MANQDQAEHMGTFREEPVPDWNPQHTSVISSPNLRRVAITTLVVAVIAAIGTTLWWQWPAVGSWARPTTAPTPAAAPQIAPFPLPADVTAALGKQDSEIRRLNSENQQLGKKVAELEGKLTAVTRKIAVLPVTPPAAKKSASGPAATIKKSPRRATIPCPDCVIPKTQPTGKHDASPLASFLFKQNTLAFANVFCGGRNGI